MKFVLVFGVVGAVLQPLPLPSGARGLLGTFEVEDDGTISLFAYTPAPGQGPELVHLTSQDSGATWSEPRHLFPIEDVPDAMRVQRDRSGALHLFWSLPGGPIRHSVRAAGSAAWVPVSLERPSGMLFRWKTGLDRCGRLTLFAWTPFPQGGMEWGRAVWSPTGGWSAFEAPFPAYWGVLPFDGYGPDGRWWLGWSGRREADGQGPTSVWLTAP